MKKLLIVTLSLVMLMGLAGTSMATNGDNLIGVGPISRAMGGVGIAAPQDALSATFANPAGMCFGPYCPGSEVNFSGTMFFPRPETQTTLPGGFGPIPPGTYGAASDKKLYAIPAFGLSVPINPQWRFGLSAFGVSGLGVDYRDTTELFGLNTQLQILKFSPNIAYLINENVSVGLGVHIDYSSLDLGEGSSFGYGLGAQVGAIFKVHDQVSIGVTYKTPQKVKHENVANFNADLNFDGDSLDALEDGLADDLELEAPQEVGVGIAFEPLPGQVLIEFDVKWVNWKDAAGYEDFDWDDQWVFAVGAQFKPTEKVAVRVGYNYGENPVEVHDGFNPVGLKFVQGTPVPEFQYEYLRIAGFPAIVEHHVTFGLGFDINENLSINMGYMHAFEETITETALGGAAVIESTLDEDSVEFGLTWRFQ